MFISVNVLWFSVFLFVFIEIVLGLEKVCFGLWQLLYEVVLLVFKFLLKKSFFFKIMFFLVIGLFVGMGGGGIL